MPAPRDRQVVRSLQHRRRYERRLVEEASKLRVELAGVEVRLADRIAQSEGTLRQEISGLEVRIIKWPFVFWLGQVVAMTAIVKGLLR